MVHQALRFVLLAAVLLCAAALSAADELRTTDGDVFFGKLQKLEAGVVHFETESVGLVKVPVEKVAALNLEGERPARVRRAEDVQHQEDAVIYTQNGNLIYRVGNTVTTTSSLSDLRGINEEVPDTRALWEFTGLGTVSMTEGNTRTLSLGYRFDLKRTRKNNFQHLFARGSYLQDRELERDSVRERKHHLGYLYRYIFDFNLTIDLTQDVYWNEFAGYRWRSITGFGPGYYIVREEKLTVHVSAHLTYTVEDQIAGAPDRDYLGARAAGEIDWVGLDDTLRVNAKAEALFDFEETKNVNVNAALLAQYQFAGYFTAGLLLEYQFDNLPPPGFKKGDFRATFTLGVSWSGRGF